MYQFVSSIHSIVRWGVVIFALLALIKAIQGWISDKGWTASDRSIGLLFTISLDIQILTGLILYFFLSPIMDIIWSDFGAALQSETLRFYALDHLVWMILGAVFAHIGSRAGKSQLEGKQKFRAVSIWYALSILAILIGLP